MMNNPRDMMLSSAGQQTPPAIPPLRTPPLTSPVIGTPTSSTATLSRTQHIFRSPLAPLPEQANSLSSTPSPASTATPPRQLPEECRVPECTSGGVVYSIDNGREEDSFNSSCKQCVAERAAAGAITSSSGTLQSVGEELEERRQPDVTQPPGRTYECESWCRETSRLMAGFFGVVLLAVSYAALGGFVFMAVELRASRSQDGRGEGLLALASSESAPNFSVRIPTDVQESLDRARFETVAKLWKVTEEMNILYPKNWTRKAAEEMMWFQDILTNVLSRELRLALEKSHTEGGSSGKSTEDPVLQHTRKREWTFARGMLYSVSLLTTVGSGVDWAMSPLSRVLTVIYILVGIPIMYLYLSASGSLFCRALTFVSVQINRAVCNRDQRFSGSGSILFRPNRRSSSVVITNTSCKRSSSQTPFYSSSTERISLTPLPSTIDRRRKKSTTPKAPPRIIAPIIGVSALLLGYVIAGSFLVSRAQGWTFRDGFYFCFLSISTVGFGGIRPSEDSAADLWPCVLYVFLGATVLSTAAHILKERVISKIKRHREVKASSVSSKILSSNNR